MRNTTRLGLTFVFGAGALLAVACGDDTTSPGSNTTAGTSTGGSTAGSGQAGSAVAGSATGGGGAGGSVAGGSGGTTAAGTGGAGGTTAGTGGSGGTGGTTAGTGGTGGTPEVIGKTVWYIDNLRLQKKGAVVGGEGGAGGADGAGGANDGGASAALAVLGAAGLSSGGAGGDNGAGGAPAEVDQSFKLTFDADLQNVAINMYGFSPNVGGTLGPAIIQDTTWVWNATAGKTGGGGIMSVPFSVPYQQADVARPFAAPVDLTGYELLVDVQLKETAKIGDCVAAWVYAWSNAPAGYANGKEGEPAMGTTQKLTKGQWTTISMDFDGPYGYHSTANYPNYKPTAVSQVGMQFVTFGCK